MGCGKCLFTEHFDFVTFFVRQNHKTQKKLLKILPKEYLHAISEAVYNCGLKNVLVEESLLKKLNKNQKKLLNRVINPSISLNKRRRLLQSGTGIINPLLTRSIKFILAYNDGLKKV